MKEGIKMELKARIHSFESFGTVDGPGIRFVLFMQGCPLKCKYCHNRDTWAPSGGEEYSIDEIMKQIMRVKPYMNTSHGGVTISGGEPLLQAPFVTELFKKLQKQKIHTALDTAGSIPVNENIVELLKYTNLVLLDIKHIDNEKCKALTGVPNTNTLKFAEYLSNNNIPMWIRQVLVPGFTDDENDLHKLKDFISSLKTVKKVELLPYHNLGKFKWEELGEKYELEDVQPPSKEQIQKAKKILDII